MSSWWAAAAPGWAISRQPDSRAWVIFDQAIARQFSRWPHFISTAPGIAYAHVDDYLGARPDITHRAPTVSALAKRAGLAPAALEAAVREHAAAHEADAA